MRVASRISVVATVVLSSFAGAAEWLQFRGPNSSGVGDGKPPVEFGPTQNVLWKTAVGPGLSSPVVSKGRVFLTEFDIRVDRRTQDVILRERRSKHSSTAAPDANSNSEMVREFVRHSKKHK